MSESKKIVWALDPFAKDQELWSKTSDLLNFLSESSGQKIQPVYVLSPDGFNWTGDFSEPWVDKFKPMAIKAMQQVIKSIELKNCLEPEVAVHPELSLKGDVKKLIDYSRRHAAQLVVLNTHSRTGLDRFFLGSFAETAILESNLPLLIVNSQTEVTKSVKKVLFATDLSDESKKAFERILPQLQTWKASLRIFHKLPDPIEPVIQTGVHIAGGGWVSVQQYLNKESEERMKSCEKLKEKATKLGIETSICIDESPGFVVDAIEKEAENSDSDIIALGAHSGPVSTLLIGSIGRQLVRVANRPVWIKHLEE